MTDNTDKLMAEALVQCGYATGWKDMSWTDNDGINHQNIQLFVPVDGIYKDEIDMAETCNPFFVPSCYEEYTQGYIANKQAHALWSYIRHNRPDLYRAAKIAVPNHNYEPDADGNKENS